MDKAIEALGRVLLALPDDRFYVISVAVIIIAIAVAFIFRHYSSK